MSATQSELTLIIRARNRASKELKNTSRDLKRINKQFDLLKKGAAQFKKVGRTAMLAVSTAVAGFALKGILDFAKFDDKMTQSLAIMGDAAQKWRGEMEEVAREVGKTTTFSASQAAEAYFFLASAGFDAQQSIAAMPQVAKFAQAGMFDLALATDLATDAQSALGMKSTDAQKNLKQLTRVTDVLVKANTLANATVEQFATSLTNKAGAAIKVVGKDIEEGTAVLAAFADQGIKGAMAGTALNIVFRDLQTKAIKFPDVFDKMGVAVFDAAGEMRNIADIIGDLEGLLEGMSDQQKKATLSQLGFSDKSVIFIQTLLGTSDAIRGYETALRDAGGMTKEVADKQLTSLTSQFKLLFSEIQDAGLTLGSKLIPGLLKLAKSALPLVIIGIENFMAGAKRISDWFAAQPALAKKMILAIGLVVIALAALYGSPIMAGLALVAAAVAFIGSSSADTARDVSTLREDLENIGRIKYGTFEGLLGKETLDGLREAGVSVEMLNDAISGPLLDNKSIFKIRDLIVASSDLGLSWEDVLDTLFNLNVALRVEEDAINKVKREEVLATMVAKGHKDALRANLIAANDLEGEFGDLEQATSEMNSETEEAIGLTKEYAGALLAAADPVFKAIDSFQNLSEVYERIDEDSVRTAAETLELGRAILETQDAFNSLSEDQIEAALSALQVALGLNVSEARNLLVEMGLLDGMNVAMGVTLTFFSHDLTGKGLTGVPGSLVEMKAHGGPTRAGQSYIVGEDGPELWTENRSGFIHPTGSFGSTSQSSGQGIVIEELNIMVEDDLRDPGAGRRFIEKLVEDINDYNKERTV